MSYVDDLKESIVILASNTEKFNSQATNCEAVYKNPANLQKDGQKDVLEDAEEKCAQSIKEFAKDITRVVHSLRLIWTAQASEFDVLQEGADIIYQVEESF